MNNQQPQTNKMGKWDRIAKNYDDNVMQTYREAYRLTIQEILEEATPSSSVLEIGCGTGIIALGVAPYVADVTGVDLSSEMIARANQKSHAANISNLNFRLADAYDLPFDDHTFDLVLLTNMLHIVADPEKVLQEAIRCVKPGGFLISVTDCLLESASFWFLLKLMTQKLRKPPENGNHLHYFRKSDLRALYKENGIKIEKEAILHPEPLNYYLSGKPD